MDPSQLFGAWLDDNTFLGGCLEISLDRFATTVQIEAYEVHGQLTGLDKQHFLAKIENIILPISFNISFGCSKITSTMHILVFSLCLERHQCKRG